MGFLDTLASIAKGAADFFPGGGLVKGVLGILKDSGAIKDPEDEAKATAALQAYNLQVQANALEQLRIGVEEQKVENEDRANARAREIAIKDLTPRILGIGCTLGFFGCLAVLAFVPIQAAAHDIVVAMTGVLGTAFITVMSYYFGSSAGSAKKSQSIDDLMKKVGNGVG